MSLACFFMTLGASFVSHVLLSCFFEQCSLLVLYAMSVNSIYPRTMKQMKCSGHSQVVSDCKASATRLGPCLGHRARLWNRYRRSHDQRTW